jgi:hypothetical protein
MRVFKVADGTSWIAKLDVAEHASAEPPRTGWEAIVFEMDALTGRQRLVYRPSGWLEGASIDDLVEALEEGLTVRARWGE